MSSADPTPPVRPAEDADLAITARLHERGLPEGFFARIGARFLRVYHAAFARSPEATVLVAEDSDGRPAGVLVGTLDNAAHYRWTMRTQGVRLAVAGLRGLVARPRLAAEFVRTRVGRYGRAVLRQVRPTRSAPGSPAAPSEPHAPGPATDGAPATAVDGHGAGDAPAEPKVAVLTHVTVDESLRGSGVGRRLVEAFVAQARRAGADEVRLITTADGPAARFYRRLGWRLRTRRRASDGEDVEEYVREL